VRLPHNMHMYGINLSLSFQPAMDILPSMTSTKTTQAQAHPMVWLDCPPHITNPHPQPSTADPPCSQPRILRQSATSLADHHVLVACNNPNVVDVPRIVCILRHGLCLAEKLCMSPSFCHELGLNVILPAGASAPS
jgi:hypothetical protein